jgi:hypothetical protein
LVCNDFCVDAFVRRVVRGVVLKLLAHAGNSLVFPARWVEEGTMDRMTDAAESVTRQRSSGKR